MTFARAKSAGFGGGDNLTSAQINTIDLNQSRAIDGNAGGTYNPSSPVVFANNKLEATPNQGDIVFQDAYIDHASHNAVRVYPVHDVVINTRFQVATTDMALLQSDVTTAGSAAKVFAIQPVYGTLTSFYVTLKGSAGHGALPAQMPSMTLIEEDPGVGSTIVIATTYDPTTSVVDYEAAHVIPVIGLSIDVRTSKLYRLLLNGETGANSQTGLKIYAFTTSVAVTRNYPG